MVCHILTVNEQLITAYYYYNCKCLLTPENSTVKAHIPDTVTVKCALPTAGGGWFYLQKNTMIIYIRKRSVADSHSAEQEQNNGCLCGSPNISTL